MLVRAGGQWVDQACPKRDVSLLSVSDVRLNGEVVVITADSRADFGLLAGRAESPKMAEL
jgi:hypothetical protein